MPTNAPAQAPPQKVLRIAAAADLQPVMPALAAAYEQETGVKLVTSFGSSSTLQQQLMNGDPQDVFLSADLSHAEALHAADLTLDAPVPYATGVLVLWARKDSPAQPLSLGSLTSPAVKRIAIANDLHAPYGLAATRALQTLNLNDVLKPKFVVGENIAQTAQMAESGNAQVGLISLTIASSPHFRELGAFVRLPENSYPAIRQCGVIMKSSKDAVEARKFLQWLTSPEVQKSLEKYGLEPAK
jgi:molybdate transport system substrate-binding protein